MYRNLHVPTTWRWLKELYDDLSANRLPSATQLAFFLGIFAGSAYISKNGFQLECPTSSRRSPIALAESWHKQAVFLLTKPPVPPSTQALQTFVMLTHLCTQIEGFAGSFGILAMSGLQMARTMRIHRLDSPHFREQRQRNGADLVDVELKRRVWWHIVASDWSVFLTRRLCAFFGSSDNSCRLLSNVGGPHEGTYLLHPSQIETFHPSNVDDEDIPTGITHITEESYSLPLSTPTSITYFLCRIQVATLSREVTDLLTPSFCTSPDVDNSDEMYNKILLLDRKYQQLLKSLPPFFQLTNRMDPNAYSALIKEKPYLESQRYLITFVIHTNLARLHRRFLIRGSTQPKFAYSRMQCIQSAETVLEVRNLVVSDKSVGSFTYIFLAHFFMAAVILAMDVCFNPTEIRVSQRKQDVLRACRVLEEELSAKMTPSSEPGNDSHSSGHLMLKAFQKAVWNLRGLLRRQMSKENVQPLATDTGVTKARQNESLTNTQATNEMDVLPERHTRKPHLNALNGDENQGQITNIAQMVNSTPQEETPILPPPYDEFQSTGEFASDELWEEFFTLGTEFNSSDWDTFLIDLDEQMSGMGSGT
jgi:hypothetical protein